MLLWCGPTAAAWIQPLAQELPYAAAVTIKRKKKKVKHSCFQSHHYFLMADSIAQWALLAPSCQVCHFHLISNLDLGLLLLQLSEHGPPRAAACSYPRGKGLLPFFHRPLKESHLVDSIAFYVPTKSRMGRHKSVAKLLRT